MARFGVEAIRYFSHARAAGVSTAGDLTYTFNRSKGFDAKLRGAGHTRAFYWANTDCWETDIRDTDQGAQMRWSTALGVHAGISRKKRSSPGWFPKNTPAIHSGGNETFAK